MTARRTIELEIEVAGTPEQVWRAIATGPGISSWYVPHSVEEREGGAMAASFGPGMEIEGRVAAWDPPRRVVFDGGEGDEGLAFEWLVESTGNGSCIVRLVNSGFGNGNEWDDQYDAMAEGWAIFFSNLRMHIEHFAGEVAVAGLPMSTFAETPDSAWNRLLGALNIDPNCQVGDRIEVERTDGGVPALSAVIEERKPHRLNLLLETPVRGTAFLAVEGAGDQSQVSMWAYLYGPDPASAAADHTDSWNSFLADLAP